MSQDKEVVEIDTGGVCMQMYPCKHSVDLIYNDGSQISMGNLGAYDVIGLHYMYGIPVPPHFDHYVKDPKFESMDKGGWISYIRKKVIAVKIGRICMKSNPCEHEVTLFHFDASETPLGVLNGRQIAKLYEQHYVIHDQHFKEYVRELEEARDGISTYQQQQAKWCTII